MRISILIDKNGNYINPTKQPNLIPLTNTMNDSATGMSLFNNQISLEFYGGVITQGNIQTYPDPKTVITSGLSGTVTVSIMSSANAPYATTLSTPTINIANTCALQWTGITALINLVCANIVGCNYINVLLDRS